MEKPRLLDLFCYAGGSSRGYQEAGFHVTGVDLQRPRRYGGDVFVQADAFEFLILHSDEFDAFAASPPCQHYSAMRHLHKQREYPDLIAPTRVLFATLKKPYIIENVMGAPLIDPVMLCGTMFGLQTKEGSQLRRHRLFECSWGTPEPPGPCQHNDGSPIGVYGGGQHPDRRRPATVDVVGHGGGHSNRDNLDYYGVDARREAMGIDWMTGKELSQAIPPAYTRYMGLLLKEQL